jgi:hypothetical protein
VGLCGQGWKADAGHGTADGADSVKAGIRDQGSEIKDRGSELVA